MSLVLLCPQMSAACLSLLIVDVFSFLLFRLFSLPFSSSSLLFFLPPSLLFLFVLLQRQQRAVGDGRQSDIPGFILPESLRMLSVPHEGSDEGRLSGRHLIISPENRLWCYGRMTATHGGLLSNNNEQVGTADTSGEGAAPTAHLRERQISREEVESGGLWCTVF